jgi:hypothetical protein
VYTIILFLVTITSTFRVNNIYWINCISYNNSTYIGIRKQVTQHLYKFFSQIPKKKRKEKKNTYKMDRNLNLWQRDSKINSSSTSRWVQSDQVCKDLDHCRYMYSLFTKPIYEACIFFKFWNSNSIFKNAKFNLAKFYHVNSIPLKRIVRHKLCRTSITKISNLLYWQPGPRVAQWVRSLDLTTHTSPSPIRRGFAPGFVNYKKACTRLAAASNKVYQLFAHGRWLSPASSTTKTGRHDIAEILLKVALKHQKSNQNQIYWQPFFIYSIYAN